MLKYSMTKMHSAAAPSVCSRRIFGRHDTRTKVTKSRVMLVIIYGVQAGPQILGAVAIPERATSFWQKSLAFHVQATAELTCITVSPHPPNGGATRRLFPLSVTTRCGSARTRLRFENTISIYTKPPFILRKDYDRPADQITRPEKRQAQSGVLSRRDCRPFHHPSNFDPLRDVHVKCRPRRHSGRGGGCAAQ